MARSDTATLVTLFDSSATLSLANGAVVRGQKAVIRALLGARLGSGAYATTIDLGRSELCRDGALMNADYSVTQKVDAGLRGVDAGVVAMYVVVSDTAARIQRVALDRTSTDALRRLDVECVTADAVRFQTRRLEVSVIPRAAGPSWATLQSLEGALASGGWTRKAAIGPEKDGNGRSLTRRDDPTRVLTSVALRISRAFRIEARSQPGTSGGILITYNPSVSSELQQDFRARQTTVALMGEWKSFRVGAGPTVVTARFHERYERIFMEPQPPNPTLYKQDFTARVDSNWTTRSVGGFVDVAYVFPFSSSIFGRVDAVTRFGPGAPVSGVPTHKQWTANLNGSYLGLGIGYAW